MLVPGNDDDRELGLIELGKCRISLSGLETKFAVVDESGIATITCNITRDNV